MSLINKMLRDLNARHASEAESALPDEVRPLPEAGLAARIGRNGMLALLGILAASAGGYWLLTAPEPAAVPSPAARLPDSAATVPATVVAAPASATSRAASTASPALRPTSTSSTLADDLVPTLPTLAKALPLAPPGQTAKSAERASSSAAVRLRLDPMLSFTPARDRAPAPAEKKATPEAMAPVLKLAAAGTGSVALRKAAQGGVAQKERTENVVRVDKGEGGDQVEKIEKVERGERGDGSFRNGTYAYKQGRTSEAVAQLQAALRDNPHHASARQALLGVYVEQRRLDEALPLLKEGLDLMPEQTGWAMALARIQVERGQTAEAWETLQKYQSGAEHSADYQGFAGVLLQHLKKPHEAALRFKAALHLKPREGRWWYALGNALEADNQATDALDAYKRAQALGGLTPAMAEAVDKKLR